MKITIKYASKLLGTLTSSRMASALTALVVLLLISSVAFYTVGGTSNQSTLSAQKSTNGTPSVPKASKDVALEPSPSTADTNTTTLDQQVQQDKAQVTQDERQAQQDYNEAQSIGQQSKDNYSSAEQQLDTSTSIPEISPAPSTPTCNTSTEAQYQSEYETEYEHDLDSADQQLEQTGYSPPYGSSAAVAAVTPIENTFNDEVTSLNIAWGNDMGTINCDQAPPSEPRLF